MKSSAPRPERGPPRIAVFAKAPILGSVKTRLAPVLGEDGAAQLHVELVRRALMVATRAQLGPVQLWCTPETSHPFFLRCEYEFGVSLHRQQGDDLGARMAHAFAQAHAAGESLVLIGSDCPALAPQDLQDAAVALEAYPAVLTPAEDGGYVLVGLGAPAPIFEGVAWGGEAVMAQTRARLEAAGIGWAELPTLWDVDRPEDYARLVGAEA